MPVAEVHLPVGAAARHARRARFLLPAADAIGPRVVGGDVIELRGRLIVPRTPRVAAVHGDERPLIGHEEHDLRIARVDPQALVVVAAGGAADGRPVLPAVGRLPGLHVRGVGDVGIGRIDRDRREIGGASPHPVIGVRARPVLAGVVRAVDPAGAAGIDRRVQPVGVARCNRDPDATQSVRRKCRETLGELPPRRAAVGGLVEPGSRPLKDAVFPRGLSRFPEHGVDRVRVVRRELQVRATRVLVLGEHLFKRQAAVRGAVDPSLGVRSIGVAEDRDKQPLGVPRIDDDARDLLPVAEAEVRPGRAGVRGLVDAVAGGEVGALQSFAGADVDDVRV